MRRMLGWQLAFLALLLIACWPMFGRVNAIYMRCRVEENHLVAEVVMELTSRLSMGVKERKRPGIVRYSARPGDYYTTNLTRSKNPAFKVSLH